MGATEIVTVIFSERISECQTRLFRGAVMSIFPESETLMHNHIDDNFRYAYPLVQYKRINGHAAITAIGQGIGLLREFETDSALTLQLGNDGPKVFKVTEVRHDTLDFATGSDLLHYRMKDWLPLNQHNYAEYNALCGISDKTVMLEKILVGNILSAAKGLGHHIDSRLVCKITGMREPRISTVKGVKMMAMDIDFCANILLPDYIGLGKNVSKGYGVIAAI